MDMTSIELDSGNNALPPPSPQNGVKPLSSPLRNQHQAPKKTSSLLLTVSNFLNSIVGAGIIGIPFAFRHTGLLAGIALLIIVGYLTNVSVKMIIQMGNDMNCNDYEALALKIFGSKGYKSVCIFMFLLGYGAMIAYMVVIGDVIPAILDLEEGGWGRVLSIFFVSIFFMLPLALLKNMASLSFTSSASVMADLILVFIILFASPVSSTVAAAGGFWKVLSGSIIRPSTMFSGVGAMSFAFVCHHSSFIVASSLKNPTQERWGKVTDISVGSATAMCLVLGLMGYLGFLEETEGDILNNFDRGLILGFGRFLLALTMVFTYPMESFVARHAILSVTHDETIANELPGPLRIKTTVSLYLSCLVLSVSFSDLGLVLELTGAISASFLAYILPALMYITVHWNKFEMCMSQAGLADSFICYPFRALHRRSQLNIDSIVSSTEMGNKMERSSSTDSADIPVEISDVNFVTPSDRFLYVIHRLWYKMKVFREFWLVMFMLGFGLLAMGVGTYTTIAGLF